MSPQALYGKKTDDNILNETIRRYSKTSENKILVWL